VASDEASFAASVERVKRLGLSMAQADFHSLSWLHYEYVQQGRFAKAREVMRTVEEAGRAGSAGEAGNARQSARGPARPALPAPPAHAGHAESEIGRGFSSASLKSELGSLRARLAVDGGDWDAMKGQETFENIDELFAVGYAGVKLGDRARAEAAVEQLRNAVKTIPDTDAREIAGITAVELDGLIRAARADSPGALKAFATAASIEAKRPKPIARPYPIKPAVELYAEALLASGDAAGAVAQFRASLARTPRRAASLIGLARAAAKAGQRELALTAAKDFLSAWHLADANRAELAAARRLAGM